MRKYNKFCKKEMGVTLLEVMIAFVIILFMTTSLSGIFYYTAQMTKQETALTEATSLAVTRLETIRQQVKSGSDFDALQSVTTYAIADDTGTELNYVYDIEVNSISNSVKYVGVNIYYRNVSSPTMQPDLSRRNNGKIVKMGTYLVKP